MKPQTIYGPQGVKLHLDPAKWHPEDPGQDTPALVEYKGAWGTYALASEAGEVDGVRLPTSVHRWLNTQPITTAVERLTSKRAHERH